MKEFWKMEKSQVMCCLDTTEEGLITSEVIRRREKYGKNILQEKKKKSVLQVFLKQFCDLLVIILILAAMISAVSKNIESTIVIGVVLLMNAILGTVQYIKAEQSLESLKQLSSPIVKVKRDGKKVEIKSNEIVIGDVIIIEDGDMVAADGRVICSNSLKVNESSLTGESLEVEKSEKRIDGNVALADRVNMVYSGSLVVYGRGEMVVTSIGMNTEIGKIANLMNKVQDRKTPLQRNLDKFSKGLAFFIISICILVLCIYLYRGMSVIDSLMFAVALAVAAIPEALGSIVTIVQAIGTGKMAKEKAIIKDLKAVESLGCVSVICSDKTGTLTKNKMMVQDIFIDGKMIKIKDIDLSKESHRYLLYDAILVNNSYFSNGKYVGDSTEYSLIEMAHNVSLKNNKTLDTEFIREWISRKEEIPFDSTRKMMSVKCILHGEETILTKGAPDFLLEKCIKVRYNNEIVEMTDKERQKINKAYEKYSGEGLRVLAFAYKETKNELKVCEECDYTFIGLIAMSDPLREETISAVNEAGSAGIKTVMITGDHRTTAVAIAKKAGIYKEGDMAVTGLMLDEKDEQWLDDNVQNISVYARVSPENKIRIVEAWQKKGNITAMTGDGVNDAPALKKADIGIAMGITGTEVSKDASTMILADDNFATIIKAVANGRNVFRNIKNAIIFLLSGNMAGILTVVYAAVLGLPAPFTPVHLLFMNLLTDSLPAIAIGMEPSDMSLLKKPPRNHKDGLLTKDFIQRIILQGSIIAVSTIISYHIGLKASEMCAATMAFLTLTMARLFHCFNCRNERAITKVKILTNKFSVVSFLIGLIFISMVVFIYPLNSLFNIADINIIDILSSILLAFAPTFIIQLYKIWLL
ncbi:cation-translocating P-type ATPase [uncultured Eubacterium sp.]|uniref:cation-translocating P-type ATPase n=1 Tax=uncultured Eubacterium sp. TaxID=165185 RepID=UPI002673B2CF|nr:cation-translocating P-type ATPase [uncultured Eubacterium sp.]